MELLWGALIIRTANLALWILAARKLRLQKQPTSLFARRMVISVIVAGSAAFAVGGLVPFGLDPDFARWIYTIVSAYSAIVAASIWTTKDIV